MSTDDDKPPEADAPKADAPKVDAPKVDAPKVGEGSGSSLFDSGWSSLLDKSSGSSGAVPIPGLGEGGSEGQDAPLPSFFAPPGASQSEPASEGAAPAPEEAEPAPEEAEDAEAASSDSKQGSSEPRTSEGRGAVSGEFDSGESTPDDSESGSGAAEAASAASDPQETRADDAEDDDEAESAASAKPDDPSTDDEGEDAVDEDDDNDEAGDEGDAPAEHEPPEAANEAPPVAEPAVVKPGTGSNGWIVVVVGAVLVILAAVILTRPEGADPQQAGQGPSKPNAARDKPAPPTPAPRSKVVARDGNPTSNKNPAAKADAETGAAPEPESGGSEESGAGGETEGDAETGETGETGDTGTAPAPAPAGAFEPRQVDDPRDPSLIPPGTPAENAKAFTKLPVSLSDGAPVGGIGRSGIHVDAVAMSSGRDNSNCDAPTRSFAVADDEFINVCVRVVHPRAAETLRVIWEKDGRVTRRGKMRIPEKLHAYKTRAYLQVRPEYLGSWRVRITPEGEEDIDLAVAEFQIR